MGAVGGCAVGGFWGEYWVWVLVLFILLVIVEGVFWWGW